MTFGLAATAADMSLAGAAPVAFEQVVCHHVIVVHPLIINMQCASLSNYSLLVLFQGLLGGLGGAVGAALASKVGPTELPQTVAAFHSLGEFLKTDKGSRHGS